MVGCLLKRALANLRLASRAATTLTARVGIAFNGPAFAQPTEPIGPMVDQQEAQPLTKEKSGHIAPDSDHFCPVVPSPHPQQALKLEAIRCLMNCGALAIATGGGGIPARRPDRPSQIGVQVAIDKDWYAGFLAQNLQTTA